MAFRLLTLWGFLDNSDVWWELLNLAWKCKSELVESESDLQSPEIHNERIGPGLESDVKTDRWLSELAQNEMLFNKAIFTLREFYFVRRNAASDSFSIHPVVHQWLRERLNTESWHANLSTAISILGRSVPYAHFHEPWILQASSCRACRHLSQSSRYRQRRPNRLSRRLLGTGDLECLTKERLRERKVFTERLGMAGVEGVVQTTGRPRPRIPRSGPRLSHAWQVR